MDKQRITRLWNKIDLHRDQSIKYAIYGSFALLFLLAMYARKSLIGFQDGDYQFFSAWYDFLRTHGLHGFKYGFSNYNPPYTYFLYFSTHLPVSKIVAIKGMMAFFDLILAASVYSVISHLYKNKYVPVGAAVLSLFLPTVLFTGVLWGQFDQLYVAFILFSLAAALRNKSAWAWALFGVAISVKFQAIFFLPVLGILSFRRIRWHDVIWGIGTFLVLTLPPVIVGRPLGSLLDIYPAQARLFNGQLTLNAPNIYQWVPNSMFQYLNNMGVVLAVCAAIAVLLYTLLYKKFSDRELILSSTLLLTIIPFILPAMHERYFFPASIAGFVLVFAYPKLAWVGGLLQLTTLFSYFPFLFTTQPITLSMLALLNLIAIFFLTKEFVQITPELVTIPAKRNRISTSR